MIPNSACFISAFINLVFWNEIKRKICALLYIVKKSKLSIYFALKQRDPD